MSRQDEWTRESEAQALERLPEAAAAGRTTPALLVYTRQSVSDFDPEGRPRGPSLDQQRDAVLRRPEQASLAFQPGSLRKGDVKETGLPAPDRADPDRAGGPDAR